jgi:uncharacterized repeat protein (TIGR01451 family)
MMMRVENIFMPMQAVWRGWFLLLAVLVAVCGPTPLQAQTNQYTVTGTDAITDSPTCASTVTRTFVVAASYTVSDVNLGVRLSHTYRSDLRITLIAPNGNSAILMQGVGGAADNLNVLFDDEAAANISTHTANDTTGAVPPYLRTFRPEEATTIFDGDNAQGNWTMVICDFVNQDTGTFTRADLYITQAPANFTDLSVSKTIAGGNTNTGDTITYTVTVTNSASATQDATGVVVRDLLPAGLLFVSSSGFGSYSSGTGNWTVGSVPIGTTRTLTINATITAVSGTVINNIAQVTAQGQTDLDSTPNNNVTNEDDYRAVSFTVGSRIPGTPPTLSCPAGTTLLDWNSQSWTSGSSTGSATVANIGTVNFAVTTQGTYSAPLALTSSNTGGFGGTQLSLFQSIEYTNISQTTTTTVTLPTAVPGVQFTVFDVDYALNDFADKLTVTGTFNGSPVTPTLTNGRVNYISAGAAIGDGASGATSADGNVVVTFSAPVDTISIVYGNHTTAPADPDGQAISIYDFNFCRPQANLSVTKISTVAADYVSASNPKAIPGALITYCIFVSNPGSGTATSVSITDPIPANVTFVPGSIRSGSNCGSATTVEDDDATDTGEPDTITASVTGSNLSAATPTLAPSIGFAIAFNAVVN